MLFCNSNMIYLTGVTQLLEAHTLVPGIECTHILKVMALTRTSVQNLCLWLNGVITQPTLWVGLDFGYLRITYLEKMEAVAALQLIK